MITIKCSNCGNELHINETSTNDRQVNYLCGKCDSIIKVTFKNKSKTKGSKEIRKKVLVAEDTRSVCEMAKDLLGKAGFDVLVAHDGEEALNLFYEESPDIMILDLRMPKKSGFDVLRDIKNQKFSKKIPVLAMSAIYRDPSNIRILRELGAAGFINKDNFAETVVERVRHCLH